MPKTYINYKINNTVSGFILKYSLPNDNPNFDLDDKLIYIAIEGYWKFLNSLQHQLNTSTSIERKLLRPRLIVRQISDYDDNVPQEALDYINYHLLDDLIGKFAENGILINKDGVLLKVQGITCVQLHFVKAINYMLYRWYKPHFHESSAAQIQPFIERSLLFLDEEYILFSYIERRIRDQHVKYLLNKKADATKRKPIKWGNATNYDDSEDAVMRSFENGTSENFGF